MCFSRCCFLSATTTSVQCHGPHPHLDSRDNRQSTVNPNIHPKSRLAKRDPEKSVQVRAKKEKERFQKTKRDFNTLHLSKK